MKGCDFIEYVMHKISNNVDSHKNKNIKRKKKIYIYIYEDIIYKIKLSKIVLSK